MYLTKNRHGLYDEHFEHTTERRESKQMEGYNMFLGRPTQPHTVANFLNQSINLIKS